ncbi:MAG: UDP-glucose 4-epimerase GalE [Candidatus Hydrogenedentes bacterium]|nr:UDP-glucose 4-epimerase GalE [Candidatus Hydrogenedentota bacterium]
MSVLVTGGAGFIGSVAVERLLAAGEPVVVLDNLSKGFRAAVEPAAAFVEGAIQDTDAVRRVLAEHRVDTVMHFAASIAVGESCTDPASYFENNVVGALSVLRAMVDSGTKHFILSSTAAVYGDPEAVPITEEMTPRPINPYGLSKRMIEQALEWYGRAYGLRSVCLRYFNACGATDRHGEAHQPETHLVPLVILAATGERECVTVFGRNYDTPDGTCIRDYIHIADLADAHLLAMRYLREGGSSEIVNLGNSVGHSVLEIIRSVERVTGKTVPVEYGERRPGDADRLVASSEKARRTLGWTPRRGDIDTIVQDAWNWRRSHPQGYGA